MGVVSMLMRDEYAVEPVDFGVQKLHAKIGRPSDKHGRSAAVRICPLNQKRGAPPAIFWIVWIARTPAQRPPRDAHGRTAAEDGGGQAHAAFAATRGTLLNRRKKFSVVWRAISSAVTQRPAPKTLAVSATYAGSLRFPRYGSRASFGASASTRMRSPGRHAAILRKS